LPRREDADPGGARRRVRALCQRDDADIDVLTRGTRPWCDEAVAILRQPRPQPAEIPRSGPGARHASRHRMARSVAAAALVMWGLFSSGCGTLLASSCAGNGGCGWTGSAALVIASVLVVERAAAGAEPLPPLGDDPPEAPITRPPGR